MMRFILVLVLVFAAPFVIWAVYNLIKGGSGGAPTRTLVITASLSTAAAFVVLAILSLQDGSRDGVYTPPRLQDGEVRPGRFDDREPSPSQDPAAR
ncbi:MAG: hypothetical protein ABL308_08935 [Oceanicaulis sp.]